MRKPRTGKPAPLTMDPMRPTRKASHSCHHSIQTATESERKGVSGQTKQSCPSQNHHAEDSRDEDGEEPPAAGGLSVGAPRARASRAWPWR